MQKRNRLHEFLFCYACAHACSGIVGRVKKMLDSIFFTPVLVPRAQAPVIASEKTPPRISPRGAALASGMVGEE
jgi:hypothetical protein